MATWAPRSSASPSPNPVRAPPVEQMAAAWPLSRLRPGGSPGVPTAYGASVWVLLSARLAPVARH
eukprot:11930956-Alexandrium_andersonii.AAC.1